MGVVKEMEFHKVSCSEYKDQVQLRFGQNEVEFKDQDLGNFFPRVTSVVSIHLTQMFHLKFFMNIMLIRFSTISQGVQNHRLVTLITRK